MRDQEHSYEIYELPDGFKVVPIEEDRPEVVVTLDRKYGFWELEDFGKIPLYSFYRLVDRVVGSLYKSWKSPCFVRKEYEEISAMDDSAQTQYYTDLAKHERIERWAHKQTRMCLSKKVHEIWQKKMGELDPELVILHKKLFSVGCGKGNRFDNLIPLLDDKEKYTYLIKDLLNYKAARFIFLDVGFKHIEKDGWMGLLGNPKNGSMRKTLMCPPNVPAYLLKSLAKWGWDDEVSYYELPEPATTRIRFLAYSTIARGKSSKWDILSKVVLRSSDEDLKKAIKYMWEYLPTQNDGDFRRTNNVALTFNRIYDYPLEIGDWDIMGLCKRSEQYHYDIQSENAEKRAKWRKKWEEEHAVLVKSKTAIPPISLPKKDEIKFLETYKDVIQEGEIMKHCIGSYAEKAIVGEAYLFHVDYKGEKASVEVNPRGYVIQSYGEKDCKNNASSYGQRVLGKWAKGLQSISKSPIIDDNAISLIKNQNGGNQPYAMELATVRVYDEDEIPF